MVLKITCRTNIFMVTSFIATITSTMVTTVIIEFLLHRSAAYIKMGQFTKAHQDAVKAKELNSEWPKVWKYKR